ncbi:MAG: FimB/Mfa2 family fimbrial subunit [Alistipes sp.]|nr:FimB/Mfa2 family fimbrial subunit [Alistipes sp.]
MDKCFKAILSVCILAVASTAGCVHQSPGTGTCTGTVEVGFYSRTRCQTDTTYPGEVAGLLVCIFDAEGILAGYRNVGAADIDGDYTQSFELDEGLYTVTAWSGLDDSVFDISKLETGTTAKTDLLLRIRRDDHTAANTEGLVVLQGEGGAFLIDPDSEQPARASVNMLEVTNRLSVSVSGLPSGPDRYSVTIEAGNGSMNIDGSVAADETLVYEPWHTTGDPGRVVSDFTLLKLETGHPYQIVITDTSDGTELYRDSLLGTLILKNPEVDLMCNHDFVIEFTAEDQCVCGTYVIARIWVNDWLVHSYSTDF